MTDAAPSGDGPTPRLSLVAVVHREQGYLAEFAASLAAQDDGGWELVVVDDDAAGHGGALLDDLAARDARVRVLRPGAHQGLGPARAAGIAAARGSHVWCVQPTDRLAPGAIAAVLGRLEETGADVLVVDHERVDRLGARRPGRHGALLRRLARDGEGVPLTGRPGLAATGAVPWDKVVRRDLLPTTGATGPALVWPALLAAERIAALPAPVFELRAAPVAPRDDVAGPAVLTGYAAVLDGLEAGAREHELVLGAAARHALDLHDRASGRRRAAVAAATSDLLRRHGVPATGGRATDLRLRLIARGRTGALRALDRALAARQGAARRKGAVGRRAAALRARRRRRRLHRGYSRARKQPVDPQLAVYAAYWYRGYSCNPRAIYEKARELAPDVRGVWVVTREGARNMPDGVDHVVAGTPEYFDVLARAKYFFNNVNFPNHLVKRAGTVHVMTHHGTPLKRMGTDLRETPVAGSRMDFPALLRRCDRWDFSVSSNPLSTLVWERVYPTGHETLETGYPRNDALVHATPDDVRRIRAELGIAEGRTAVLYAPTHREWQSGYVPVVDIAAVADALGDDHVVLARTHYFYDREPAGHAGQVIDVAAHPSIEELCLAADVLVTDYSSLMFDYAVLDRPVVIHAPDWEVYRAMRGTYFDLMAEPPGVVTRTEDELVAALRSGEAAGEGARELRAAFRARFCALEDGRAAERVVRRVFLGEPVPAPPAAAPVQAVAAS